MLRSPSAAETGDRAIAPASVSPARERSARRLVRGVALGSAVPLGLLVFWHLMVRWTGTRLIPPPREVAVTMWDFAVGGIYDDAYSASLPVHLWKSVQRVYGGFL